MSNDQSTGTKPPKRSRTGAWIAGGLLLGILVGVLFGEYCGALGVVGNAYVGLLQMTVLPFLMISLVAKMGRLNLQQAKQDRPGGADRAAVLLGDRDRADCRGLRIPAARSRGFILQPLAGRC